MRVFVAGASGVIGRRAVDRLVAAGHEVTGVVRTDAKAARLRAAGGRPAQIDLFDPDAVRAAVEGHDAVCNLATHIPPTAKMAFRRAWATNDRLRGEASRILVDAALATGASRYVQESIALLYADAGAAWVDEDAPDEPTPILASALTAEDQAARFTGAGGSGVVLRFGQFVSADSDHLQTMLPMLERGVLPLVGDHDGYVSEVHADDAAAAVVAALDAPEGRYNVAEDEPLTRAQHAAVLSEVLGRAVHLPPPVVGSLPRVKVQGRSLRIANRRMREATTWRPRYASMREVWPELVAALRQEGTSS